MKNLSLNEKAVVTKTTPNGYELNEFGFPILRKTELMPEELDRIEFLNVQNTGSAVSLADTFLLFFREDKYLKRYGNNPFKYAPQFQTALAVATPDFSVLSNMNQNEIRHNIFLNRWIGCWWQYYGCRVIPTIAWCNPDTYDICFSGLEPGGAVIISTIGCCGHEDVFLQGYDEMMKRLSPSIIFVYGKVIDGIYGNIYPINYDDSFRKRASSYIQGSLFIIPRTLNIVRGEIHG